MGKSPSQNFNKVIVNNKEFSRIPTYMEKNEFYFLFVSFICCFHL